MNSTYSDAQYGLLVASEIIFVVINILSCVAALVVYGKVENTKMKPLENQDLDVEGSTANPNQSPSTTATAPVAPQAANSTTATTSVGAATEQVTEGLKKAGKWSLYASYKAFQGISESSGWVMTNFMFFIFLLVGLAMGQADPSSFIQAIIYFVIASLLMCSVYYPVEVKDEDMHAGVIFKTIQYMFIIAIIVLVVISVPTYGVGTSSLFVIMTFSHGLMLLLFDLLTSSSFPIVSQSTIDKNLKIYSGYNTVIAEYSPIMVKKYNDRIFKGFYGLAVILNAMALLLSTWAQFSTNFGNSVPVPEVNSLELTASAIPKYGICSADTFTLNVIDTVYLVEMAAFFLPTDGTYDCGFYEPSNLIKCLNFYFTPNYTKPSLGGRPYNWQLLNVTIPKNNQDSVKTAFYGIKSDAANLIVVAVRGSTIGRDWLTNFDMYAEAVMLQVFSLIIPYIYIWPFEATQYVVKALSFMDTLAFLNNSGNYYNPVVEYVEYLQNKYPTYNITVMGHSLGGSIASIVGARTAIRSFNFEPPGNVYSALKFGISGFPTTISQSGISTVRINDPIPWVDKQVYIF